MNLDRVIVTVIVYDLIVAKIKPVLTYGTGPNDYFSNRLTSNVYLAIYRPVTIYVRISGIFKKYSGISGIFHFVVWDFWDQDPPS